MTVNNFCLCISSALLYGLLVYVCVMVESCYVISYVITYWHVLEHSMHVRIGIFGVVIFGKVIYVFWESLVRSCCRL